MLLTLHNVKQIEQKRLPIHGAMVNIVLNNGTESNIIIVGDSGAGKSESLEAFRGLNENYIRHMRVIFDDMGFLKKKMMAQLLAMVPKLELLFVSTTLIQLMLINNSTGAFTPIPIRLTPV